MKEKKEYIEQVQIIQEKNGYIIIVGSACSSELPHKLVFQSFTELVNFLNEHFTYRNELIFTDYNNQISITLKNN